MLKSADDLKGKGAWARYNKLLNRVTLFADRGEHFTRSTGIARDILLAHTLSETNRESSDICEGDDSEEVLKKI